MIIQVIRPGEPVVSIHATEGTTVGEFLSAHGLDASGRAIVLNSDAVNESTVLRQDSQLLLAKASKGGI